MKGELRQAHEAIQRRHETLREALGDDEVEAMPGVDFMRRINIGMELDAHELEAVALEYAEAICASVAEESAEALEAGRPYSISLGSHVAAAWMDGVTVGAMLFLLRQGGNIR